MNFLELLAEIFEAETMPDDARDRITEAYEFDRNEIVTGYDAAAAEANTEIARLNEALEAAKAEIVAVKAMNFDKLMGGAPGETVSEDIDDTDTEDGDPDDTLSLDELIMNAEVR